MNETETTRAAAITYFDAWRERDFDLLRTVLAPDVEFVGVLGTAYGADDCIAGLRARCVRTVAVFWPSRS